MKGTPRSTAGFKLQQLVPADFLPLMYEDGRTTHTSDHPRAASSGLEKKGSFGKGVFSKRPSSRDSRELILESQESPECGKGESYHLMEILKNLEILEILEIPGVKRPFS